MFKGRYNSEMKQSRGTGIITRIYKNGVGDLLKNFRPIAIRNTIYKLRDTVITTRITPITNLLTGERQHAYKANKSTIGVIYNI